MDVPGSVAGVAFLLLAVLPGAAFTWALERQVGSYGVSFADRTLRFVGVSIVFHLVALPFEYLVATSLLAESGFDWGDVLTVWPALLLLFAIPYGLGSVLGGLYRSRSARDGHWTWVRRRLSEPAERRLLRVALGHDPAPRAWDHLFADRSSRYLRVRLQDGTWVAGLFADRSYAGGYPNPTDLLLEQAWSVDPVTGEPADQQGPAYPVYVPASEITLLEELPEAAGSPDDRSPE